MLTRTLKRLLTCRSLKCFLCSLLIVVFTIILFVFLANKSQTLLNTEAKRTLADLCYQYKTKKVTGSLCRDLCDLKTLKFKSSFSGGSNKNVILMEWQDTLIILKSRVRDHNDLSPLTVWKTSEDQGRVSSAPKVDFFEMLIYDEVVSLLQTTIPEDKRELISKLSDENYDPQNKKPSLAFMNTLMNLVQQEEYVNFKYHRKLTEFPRIYGYCGHFYSVEYLPPDQMLSSISLTTYSNTVCWRNRAVIALKLLDIFVSLDGDFDGTTEETHMCDVKAENFGVGDDLAVKIIDGDMIFSSAKMKSILEAEDCTMNSECDFFDCEGICEFSTGRCSNRRRNFNLQVLCRDIFSTGLRGTQLLRNPPAKFKEVIQNEVTKCSSLSRHDLRKAERGWNPSMKLRQLLTDSLLT